MGMSNAAYVDGLSFPVAMVVMEIDG